MTANANVFIKFRANPDNVFDQMLVRKCWIFCQDGTLHVVILRSKWLCNVNVMDGVTTANFYFCCSHHIIKENKYLFYKKTEILLECKVFQKKQIFVDSVYTVTVSLLEAGVAPSH